MIIYALVARGSLILSEYTAFKGDFTALAQKILAHSKPSKLKKSFTKDGYVFTFFSEDDFTFLCLNKTNVSRDVVYRFLDQLAEIFFSNHGKYDHNSTMQAWGNTFSLKIKTLLEDYEQLSPELVTDPEGLVIDFDDTGSNKGSLLAKGRIKKLKSTRSKGLLYAKLEKKDTTPVFDRYKGTLIVLGALLLAGSLVILLT